MDKNDFWQEVTLEYLAQEQGITNPQRFEELFGSAYDLWECDEDFEAFLSYTAGIVK
jgi:hypothetical protein